MKKAYSFSFKPVNNLKIEKFLKQTKREFDEFFNINLPLPRVFLINSRKDYNKYQGKKTKPWMVGWAENNFIFILHPDRYTKESNHKNKKGFWKALKHEHCHLYYKKLTRTNRPKWLDEGLACYLSKQITGIPNIREALEVIELYSRQGNGDVYLVGTFWVKFLIEKFGRQKFIRFIKGLGEISSEQDFKKYFYKIYKVKFTKVELKKILKNNIQKI